MKFLLKLDNRFRDGEFVETVAVEADMLGFFGFLMSDHYMWQSREPRDVNTLESWATLTYLAAKTDKIRLGTQFSPIPFRNPAIFAKTLSTIDVLSGGRIMLGVGAGWSQAEFEGYSKWSPPKTRVDKTIEGLELMIKLWTEDEVTFDGKHYHTHRAVLEPKPIQKPYPLLFVSGRARSYRMLGLAGRRGDLFNVTSQTAEGDEVEEREVTEGKEYVFTTAKNANRANKVGYAINLRRSQYNSKKYSEDIEAAIKSEASYLITYFPPGELYLDHLKNFAKEVMPSYT
jgi:alkanesulfonate monooxygenase SsuD/methylene tetrahydromethanopterin reductase-like flavin-dependent oxidoreductase (luciferase family)